MPDFYRKSKLLRRSRVFWGSFSVWRPRLVFWCGALATGVISVTFAKLADLAQHGFNRLTTATEWSFLLPLLLTPAGFALSAYLAMRLFPNAQGSGIPQAIAARHLKHDEDRGRLLSLRIAVGKILLTVLGLFSGASIGREGPTVQVGASIMLAAARFGGMAQARGLILAGSAAGIAAAFNTPLAGIVFAIEEMGRTYEARTNGIVLAAVIISGLAALGFSGSYHYFGSIRRADRHKGLGARSGLRHRRRRARRRLQRHGAAFRPAHPPLGAAGTDEAHGVAGALLRSCHCRHRRAFGRQDLRHRL